MTAQMTTIWQSAKPKPKPTTDHERHELFMDFVNQTLVSKAPWLIHLLDSANATVVAGPGQFMFSTQVAEGVWHEVPEISKLIDMVPWAEDHETTQ
ncbi:hypothetical protein [Rhodoferax sp. GW822-FHT02A01]|uniref:hypothetical protein n=1 Tax=Rhodoferax sp. GW822-FHT02A01 TaxID=3141537 RepID=UPI00315D7538